MECLLRASHEGDINSLYMTIQEHPTILEQVDATPFIDTPLHIAASAGHIEYAMEIAGLKPSFARKRNQQGSTPMHVALEQNQTEMVSWLLDFDAELVRVKGREGATPLHYVVQRGERVLLEKFLEKAVNAIMDLTIRRETAFHVALKSGEIQAFDLLFEKLECLKLEDRAKILNAQDREGNTILHHAAADANQEHVVKKLLKWDISNPGKLQIDAKNQKRQTALDIATAHRHESIEHLLRASQEINGSITYYIRRNDFYFALRDRLGKGTSLIESLCGETASKKIRSDLLVVAALMAAASFQLVLQPPGGLNTEGHANLYHKDDAPAPSPSSSSSPSPNGGSSNVFYMIIFFNTLAFVVSITTILLLIDGFPMFWAFYAAAYAMLFTYYLSLMGVTRIGVDGRTIAVDDHTTWPNWFLLLAPALIGLMLLGGRGWHLSRRKTKSKPKSKSAPADENAV